MILNEKQVFADSFPFDWHWFTRQNLKWCTTSIVEYIYSPCCAIDVTSRYQLSELVYAIEEEALMYLVNEARREGDIQIKDINMNDIVVISKHTSQYDIDTYSEFVCWKRKHSHMGDLYENVDFVFRPKDASNCYYDNQTGGASIGASVVMKITPIKGDFREASSVQFAVIENTENIPYTVHKIKHHQKASTLDIMLGMQ